LAISKTVVPPTASLTRGHRHVSCLKGRAFLVRYADDFVMGFAYEGDARRVLGVLPTTR
jgi:hypothetical protein